MELTMKRIDATDITDLARSDAELENFCLFCIAVAGKTAKTIARQLHEFLSYVDGGTPFEKIKTLDKLGYLEDFLKTSKLGQYTKLTKAFRQAANSGLDLRTCSTEDLEKIHGIGPKTSRFFVLHSRRNAEVAVLDTHILKYMAKNALSPVIPKTTPSGRLYADLERTFIAHAKELKRDIAELDLEIWNSYARK